MIGFRFLRASRIHRHEQHISFLLAHGAPLAGGDLQCASRRIKDA